MRRFRSGRILTACVFIVVSAVANAADPEAVPVGADWEGYNKSLDGQRFSPLDQINVSNAASLVEVCRVRVASRGSLQSGLVVTGGSIFVSTATETMALDSTTCRVKWQHSYHRAQDPGLSVNRGVAVLNGRVFRGTDDGRLLALDAATGREVWTSVVGDPTIGEYVVSAPVAWNGLVIVGISGGEFGIRGRILAYDVLTGREVWRFNTIPVGKEVGADTWGDRKWSAHGGGGIVMTGDNAGNFLVFESDSGKLLHKEPTGGALAGGVATYWQGGKQYVAFTSGNVSPTAFGSVGRPSVVVMSLPGGAPNSTTTSNTPDVNRGKQLFTQICAGCHGPEGDRIAGKELKPAARRLNQDGVATFILNPVAPMPKIFPEPRSVDDERDVRDVAAFVASWSH